MLRKNRRLSKQASANLAAEFKLKSGDTSRDIKPKKMLSTTGNFRYHQHLFQESKSQFRNNSKDRKPVVVEQLRLFTKTQEQDFRLPKSLSKRSASKNIQNEKSRLERLNNQMYENLFVKTEAREENKSNTRNIETYLTQRKFKSSSVNQMLKEKLQRTAMERFQQAVLKENEENRSGTERKAEALFKFLRDARIRQQQRTSRYRKDQTEDTHTSKPQPSMKAVVTDRLQGKRTIEQRKNSQEMMENKEDFTEMEEAPQIVEKVDESWKKGKPKSIKINETRKGSVTLPQGNLQQLMKEVNQLQRMDKDLLPSDEESEEVFKQIDSIPVVSKKSNISSEKGRTVDIQGKKENKVAKAEPKIRKNSDNIQPPKQQFKKIEEEAKSVKKILQIDPLKDLPQAVAFDMAEKKVAKEKIKNQEKDTLNLNNHTIQKVLTTQFLSQKGKTEQTKTKDLPAPPKLLAALPTAKSSKINYSPEVVQDDDLEQIDWDKNKKKEEPKKNVTQNHVPQKQQVAQPAQKAPEKGTPPQKAQQNVKGVQEQSRQDEGFDQQQADALDALIFYIDKIEDIGQYRLVSRDLYSDKGVSKDLVDIHKVCAYYMSHQFYYLTKSLFDLLKSPRISKDYFEITAAELSQLKDEGQLDQDIQTLEQNLEQAKKLLKKCYDDCKPLLAEQERILLLDGKTNYNLKCCGALIKEFRKVHALWQAKPQSETIKKRCCYLIELFCLIKLFAGEELKEAQEVEEIEDLTAHIETYQHLLIGR